MARLHPTIPLIAFTNSEAVKNQLALAWGADSFCVETLSDTDSMVRVVDRKLLDMPGYEYGDQLVIVAGAPPGRSGSTNMVHVHRLGEEDR